MEVSVKARTVLLLVALVCGPGCWSKMAAKYSADSTLVAQLGVSAVKEELKKRLGEGADTYDGFEITSEEFKLFGSTIGKRANCSFAWKDLGGTQLYFFSSLFVDVVRPGLEDADAFYGHSSDNSLPRFFDARNPNQVKKVERILDLFWSLKHHYLAIPTGDLKPEPEPDAKPKPELAPVAAKPKPRPTPKSTKAEQPRRTFVLVVGVNDYTDDKIPSLRFAENDARDIFAFYATDARSPTERDRVTILAGKKATRLGVLKAIREELVKTATEPTDAVVLYFAGHGFSDADETYLACADTQLDALMETSISLTVLQSYWSRIRASTKLLVTDACHSGGLANLRGLTVRKRISAGKSKVSAVIAAAGPNELSAEDEDLGKGIFTTVLLNGLRGNADADKNGNVTLGELKQFLVETVPARAREVNGNQTPVVEIHGPGAGVSLTR